jgi:predicted DNA-binding protein
MIALRLPAELREQVERIAKRKGVSISQVIREAIEKFTERRKP